MTLAFQADVLHADGSDTETVETIGVEGKTWPFAGRAEWRRMHLA